MMHEQKDKPTAQEHGFLTDSTNAPKLKHRTRVRVLSVIGVVLVILIVSFVLQSLSSS